MITEEEFNELVEFLEEKLWNLHNEEKEFREKNYPLAIKEYLDYCNRYVPSEEAKKELEDVQKQVKKWTQQRGKITFISYLLAERLKRPEIPNKVREERPNEILID